MKSNHYYKKRKIAHCILTDESTILVDILGSSFLIQEDKNNISNIWSLLTFLEEQKNYKEILNFITVKQTEKNTEIEDDLNEVLNILEQSGIIEKISDENMSAYKNIKNLNSTVDFFDFFTVFQNKSKYEYYNKFTSSKIALINEGELGAVLLNLINQMGINSISYYDIKENNINYSLHENAKIVSENTFKYDDQKWKKELESPDLIIVSTSNTNRKLLTSINSFALEKNKKLLFVEIEFTSGKIGPALIGGETACYECAFQRKRMNIEHDYLKYFDLIENNEKKNIKDNNFKTFIPFYNILSNYTVIEIMKILTGYLYPETYKGIYEFNFIENKITHHPVLKFPYCPSCGKIDRVPAILDSNKEVIHSAG